MSIPTLALSLIVKSIQKTAAMIYLAIVALVIVLIAFSILRAQVRTSLVLSAIFLSSKLSLLYVATVYIPCWASAAASRSALTSLDLLSLR
jgi:hypothetical protein